MMMSASPPKLGSISAIIPARNEEAVIAQCVGSLVQQPQIFEILVIDDQSSDRTAEIVRGLAAGFPQVKLLQSTELPAGWVGKNNAVWLGAQQATGEWLLFTDADAEHAADSAAKALSLAAEHGAAMVSLSPEQLLGSWYEKSLIPYVYSRLARRFPFEEVNDPQKSAAAANGQFILIRREAYETVGGHASVAGEVLEDVALARRVKSAGLRIWFCSGTGIVRVRMYRSFLAMWEGWKKNIYPLMGGTLKTMRAELLTALWPPVAVLLAAGIAWKIWGSYPVAVAVLVAGLIELLLSYGADLKKSGFPQRLLAYGLPGRLLFAAVLWASYRSHQQGTLNWKGRAYPAGTPRASKGLKTPWSI